MRISNIVLVLMLSGLSVASLSCASEPGSTLEGQEATVQRGNLSLDITAVGNLALAQKVDLAFEMAGTVSEVLAEAGESVDEGQVLVKLDTTEWQDQLIALEDAVTTAERNVTTKERAVTSAERDVTAAERNVTTAERNVTSKKRAVLQAEISLHNAELALENAKNPISTSGGSVSVIVVDPLDVEIKELGVELARGQLEDAQRALDDAETVGIDDARQAVEDAKVKVEDARQVVKDARKALEDTGQALEDGRNASNEITAPFAGFITSVGVSGGDEVKKGTVAATIADPTKFEAEVMISEVNILQVKLGGDASVQVEAMPGVSLPAEVTQIAPSATIQSGVVNYKVKVELTSLQPITLGRQGATGNVTAGASSGRFGRTFGSANLTQEQINQMMQQRQQLQSGQTSGQQALAPIASTGTTQLAEGMTVTVSIMTAARNNVLLVPSQAVISQGAQTIVQVQKDGVMEERPVQVGISNWQYAEIISGLSEGEQIIVPKGAITATSTTQQQQRMTGGIMQIPGVRPSR